VAKRPAVKIGGLVIGLSTINTFTIYEKVFFKGNIQVTHKDNIKDRIFCVEDVLSDDWEIVEDIVDEWTNKHLKDVENETKEAN